MKSLRPEVRTLLWRWREVAVGVAVAAFGLWWAVFGLGIMPVVGGAVALVGVALTLGAVQRLRFARGGGGAGVVQIDERRVAYFGPLTGGVVDLDDLATLALDGTGKPAHWRLLARGGDTLDIPVDAENADALFDAFAALPGLRAERLIAALNGPRGTVTPLWSRGADPNLARIGPR